MTDSLCGRVFFSHLTRNDSLSKKGEKKSSLDKLMFLCFRFAPDFCVSSRVHMYIHIFHTIIVSFNLIQYDFD